MLDTYYPELGRYGTGAAMHAAEAVFAADSAVAIAALTVTAAGRSDLHAITAASFADLATAFTGSLSSGLRWLVDHVKHHPAPVLAREIYDQAMRLADPSGDWATLSGSPGGEKLTLACDRRRSALATYRAHLNPAEGPDPERVLAALLHLHHARVLGINRDSERTCLRLARAVALGWVARDELTQRQIATRTGQNQSEVAETSPVSAAWSRVTGCCGASPGAWRSRRS